MLTQQQARAQLLNCVDQAKTHLTDPGHDLKTVARQLRDTGLIVLAGLEQASEPAVELDTMNFTGANREA